MFSFVSEISPSRGGSQLVLANTGRVVGDVIMFARQRRRKIQGLENRALYFEGTWVKRVCCCQLVLVVVASIPIVVVNASFERKGRAIMGGK